MACRPAGVPSMESLRLLAKRSLRRAPLPHWLRVLLRPIGRRLPASLIRHMLRSQAKKRIVSRVTPPADLPRLDAAMGLLPFALPVAPRAAHLDRHPAARPARTDRSLPARLAPAPERARVRGDRRRRRLGRANARRARTRRRTPDRSPRSPRKGSPRRATRGRGGAGRIPAVAQQRHLPAGGPARRTGRDLRPGARHRRGRRRADLSGRPPAGSRRHRLEQRGRRSTSGAARIPTTPISASRARWTIARAPA